MLINIDSHKRKQKNECQNISFSFKMGLSMICFLITIESCVESLMIKTLFNMQMGLKVTSL